MNIEGAERLAIERLGGVIEKIPVRLYMLSRLSDCVYGSNTDLASNSYEPPATPLNDVVDRARN